MTPTTRNRIALGVLLVVAAALRAHDIDRLEIWVDEANSYVTARRSWPEILRMLRLDSSPPVYYFLLHGWIGVFGDGPVAIRSLSASFGVALVAAVYLVGSRWWSPAAGLWAGAFVALSPTHIFFSQQVRMYSLLPLLALASVASLVRFLESGSRRDWVWCVLATIAALYTHNFAFHLLPVLAVVVLLSGQLLERWRDWLASVVVISVAYLPWLSMLQRQMANEDHYAWYLPIWKFFGAAGVAWQSLKSFSPAGEFLMFNHVGALEWGGWPTAAALALAAFGVYQVVARRSELGLVGVAWVPLLWLLPMATAIGASVLMTPHFVPGRVDQMMYPAYALLLGVGAAQLRPRVVAVVVGLAVVAVGLAGKSFYATDYSQRGFLGADRELAALVRETFVPGDVIVTTSLSRASLEYYLRDLDLPIVSFPRSTAAHLGAQNDWRLIEDREGLAREARAVIDTVRAQAGPRGRMILLRSRLTVNNPLGPEQLNREFSIITLESLGRFAQAGTEDVIWVTLNRLRLDPSSR